MLEQGRKGITYLRARTHGIKRRLKWYKPSKHIGTLVGGGLIA